MTWNGDKVSQELNITGHQEIGHELYGMAYRRNPKRAHLIVSTVLGKHIPQSPRRIIGAMEVLGDKIQSHLTPGEKATVIGYAETAVAMGAALAEHLGAPYLHSTRYPRAGTEYGTFTESHSHAASHVIYLKDHSLLSDQSRCIILVDDELSTGNTIMNTVESLEKQSHHPHYLVATLTDMRSAEHRRAMDEFARERGITIEVESLLELSLNVPQDSLHRATHLLSKLNGGAPHPHPRSGRIRMITESIPRSPLHSGANHETLHSLGEKAHLIGKNLEEHLEEGNTLILGVEEEMYLPLKIAQGLESAGREVRFSSSTLSPVLPHDGEDYAIRSAIEYRVPGEHKPRYAYNLLQGEHGNIVLIANGDTAMADLKELIARLAPLTNNLIILNLQGESA